MAVIQDGPLAARLALWGLLPRRHARRRLRTALALLELEGGARLELEGCVGEGQAALLAAALERLRRGPAPGGRGLEALAVTHCGALAAGGLRRLLAAAYPPSGLACPVELDLRGCSGLGDAAAEALAPLLAPGAPGPQRLGLAACGLGPAGAPAPSEGAGRAQRAAAAPALGPAAALAAGHPPDALVPAPPSAESSTAAFAPPPLGPLAGPLGGRGAEPRLIALELSSNALAGAGRSLAALVRALLNLEVLSLESCSLTLDDVQSLARSLPRSSLKRLDLAGNSLRSKGLLAVAGGVRMSRIEDLGLERNEIGVGEALAELRAAHDRRPFPSLRLGGNLLTPRQEAAFLRSLRTTPVKRFGGSYCPPGCSCFEGRGEVM